MACEVCVHMRDCPSKHFLKVMDFIGNADFMLEMVAKHIVQMGQHKNKAMDNHFEFKEYI